MFEHVGEKNIVEFPPLRKTKLFDIDEVKIFIVCTRLSRQLRIAFDADHMMSLSFKNFPQVAAGNADIENSRRGLCRCEKLQDPIMAVVFEMFQAVDRGGIPGFSHSALR